MADPTLYAGDTILTYSGHYLNVFNPNPDHLCIEDIAHALSNIPRFAGHLEKNISVAEHSVKVSFSVPDEFALEALLHDASEAYLMDIPNPIKNHLPDYQALENNLMAAISSKFGFPHPISPEVKMADRNQLELEHEYLRIQRGECYNVWGPSESKTMFLHRFKSIMQKTGKEVSNG